MSNEKYADAAARKYGLIYCYGPNGEEFTARTQREAGEKCGISKSSVNYCLMQKKPIKGWNFKRIKEANPNDWRGD